MGRLGYFQQQVINTTRIDSLHSIFFSVARFDSYVVSRCTGTSGSTEIVCDSLGQPFVDGAGSEGWTVFDLRNLRGEAIRDPSLKRLVLGYDLLVLIPEATPATQIR